MFDRFSPALLVAGIVAVAAWPHDVAAADWPAYRYDAARSAASPEVLPAEMHLHWVRHLPPLRPAWPDQALMRFDAAYAPIVAGKTLFVASPLADTVTAYHTETGAEKWRFTADGPVRFSPLAWEDRLFFVSDDGHLYCLDAASGKLLWKFRGGPEDRHILGNGRLISMWPARGGPVMADSTIYFAASIWPFMGVFIHALDARTGKVQWTNDGDGSTYMKQPHNADSFAAVAPQGNLVVSGDHLLVPGGRSVPACYDRRTGKLVHYLLAENSKSGGGSEVAAAANVYFNGGVAFDLKTGKKLGTGYGHVVPAGDTLYASSANNLRALDLKSAKTKAETVLDRKGKKATRIKWEIKQTGTAKLRDLEAVIKAGERLYAATAAGEVVAIELPLPKDDDDPPVISWRAKVDGAPVHLLAADGRLFVVTLEGHLYCFGPGKVETKTHALGASPAPRAGSDFARAVAEATKVRDGYCIVWGIGSGRLVSDLIGRTSLHLIVIEPDAAKVAAARREWQEAGLYGDRVAVHHGDPLSFSLPPYLACLMVCEDLEAAGFRLDAAVLRKLYEPLRPYGGVACLNMAAARHSAFARQVEETKLPGARVTDAGGIVLLSREGALPGAGNWTHEHADAANTRVSPDRLARAPLGLLWFGGPSHDGILPRHGHGPQPQVIDGRLIIEGVDMLRCTDIYTGRVLWETKLPGVGTFYNNTSHQPGANAAGTNFVSTSDGIYVLHDRACLKLDPSTGKELARYQFPSAAGEPAPEWGYLNVAGNYLVGCSGPEEGVPDIKGRPDPASRSSSKRLVVLDRKTGEVLWTTAARDGFRHNTVCIGGGRLYAVDRISGELLSRLKRRGETPKHPPRLVAFDLKSGKELWHTEANVFGTWLSYSEKHDVLVEAGRVTRDALKDEPKGMRAYKAETGDVLWFQPSYGGPAMIRGDQILKDRGACDLLTGEPYKIHDPLTGQMVEWNWTRTYGCNTPAASECLLTFRSGAAGYYDLLNDGGTGNFGGFRSSCTNNLIVAGGLINAPDYTRTCTCSYQNQTSLALVHMPDVDMWTYTALKKPSGPIRRLGLNLGAPGDRRSADGTLWLEYPMVGGPTPEVKVKHEPGQVQWFRRHTSQFEGSPDWVVASGASGLETLTATLGGKDDAERVYTVRLYFAEPEELGAGKRVFHVALQGKRVLENLDVSKEAGGPGRGLVKEFKGIRVGQDLDLSLIPARRDGPPPILSGIEVVAEGW